MVHGLFDNIKRVVAASGLIPRAEPGFQLERRLKQLRMAGYSSCHVIVDIQHPLSDGVGIR